MFLQNVHMIYAVCDKNCDVSCRSIKYICLAITKIRAARWRTSINGTEKLLANDSESSMKFWGAVLEKSVLTIFLLLWPLAIQFGTKLVLTLHVAISANGSKSGRHDGGLMALHKKFDLLWWCKVILNSDEPIMKNGASKQSCHICGLWQKIWSLLLKYYIHSLINHVIQGGTMADYHRWKRQSVSVDWENIMKFWGAVFEKSVLTIFVLLWPLALRFSAKLVLYRHVSVSSNEC